MQSLILPDSDGTKIAVALSGGADSMALAHMLAHRKPSIHIHALTVDHGLRPDSAAEAASVAKWVSKWPALTHTILNWSGKKPATGIMDAARKARYRLMADYCRKGGITHLALAHHGDDQAETFFMRVAHGSGLDGLAGMKPLQPYNDALTLWRPLLGYGHDDLVAYCRAHKIKWVEDPSNSNEAYTRARLRNVLAQEGFSPKRLGTTLARIDRAQAALKTLAARLGQAALKSRTATQYVYDLSLLRAEPFELVLRVLRDAIETLGRRGAYGPRLDRLEVLAAGLLGSPQKTAVTLGGCVLRVDPARMTLKILCEAT